MTPSITKSVLIGSDSDAELRRRLLLSRDENNNERKEQEPSKDPVSSTAPKIYDVNYLTAEHLSKSAQSKEAAAAATAQQYKDWRPQIKWPDLIVQLFVHIGAVYGLYLVPSAKLYSVIWCKIQVPAMRLID